MTTQTSPSEAFTVLDWIGTIVAGSAALGLLLFPLVGRSFDEMFRDFGGARLPPLTALAVSWWFPLLLAALPIAALGQASRASLPLQARRAWAVGAFLLAIAGLAVCLIGVYAPIFDLAGQIKVDRV